MNKTLWPENFNTTCLPSKSRRIPNLKLQRSHNSKFEGPNQSEVQNLKVQNHDLQIPNFERHRPLSNPISKAQNPQTNHQFQFERPQAFRTSKFDGADSYNFKLERHRLCLFLVVKRRKFGFKKDINPQAKTQVPSTKTIQGYKLQLTLQLSAQTPELQTN